MRSWRGPPAGTSAAAGALLTEDPDRAHVEGFVPAPGFGELFAVGYAAGFAVLGTASRLIGAAFGLLHAGLALVAPVPLLAGVHPWIASERAGGRRAGDSRAALEPPGLLGLHCGPQTPLVTTVAHLAYDAKLGLLLDLS